MWLHGLLPTRLLCPWHSPGKNTGGSCYALLQGIFPTLGSNPHLLHSRGISFFTAESLRKPNPCYHANGHGPFPPVNVHVHGGLRRLVLSSAWQDRRWTHEEILLKERLSHRWDLGILLFSPVTLVFSYASDSTSLNSTLSVQWDHQALFAFPIPWMKPRNCLQLVT